MTDEDRSLADLSASMCAGDRMRHDAFQLGNVLLNLGGMAALRELHLALRRLGLAEGSARRGPVTTAPEMVARAQPGIRRATVLCPGPGVPISGSKLGTW